MTVRLHHPSIRNLIYRPMHSRLPPRKPLVSRLNGRTINHRSTNGIVIRSRKLQAPKPTMKVMAYRHCSPPGA